jgi:2-polyprenyl-3-methyl-5-hydroxy-6-metoxy-1,4-benzoquinol methylase
MANLRSYWNDRYGSPKRGEASASGTFTHLEEANRWFYRAKYRRVRDIVARNGIELRGRAVLDVACGTGAFVPLWLQLGAAQVTGLDLADNAVEKCRMRFADQPACRFQQFDLSDPAPEPARGQFDLVCIFEAIFLLTDEKDFSTGLGTLCAWLRPGGWLLLTDQMPQETVVRHERLTYHSRAVYEHIFQQHGVEFVSKNRQSCLFNRHIFPEKIQYLVESRFPWLLYGLDRLMLKSPIKNRAGTDEVYYCLARKKPQPPG